MITPLCFIPFLLIIVVIFQAGQLTKFKSGEEYVKLQSGLKACEIEKDLTNGELQMAKGLKNAVEKERDHLLEVRGKLIKRVDVVEKDLGVCHEHEIKLKEELCQVGEDRDQLSETVRDLEERLASKETLDFLNLVKQMGSGGDSWVCADDVRVWSYGYISTTSFSSHVTIHNFIHQLTWESPIYFPSSDLVQAIGSDKSIMIIGYEVRSHKYKNGWWRRYRLDKFGGNRVEFFARDRGVSYDVEVFYVIG